MRDPTESFGLILHTLKDYPIFGEIALYALLFITSWPLGGLSAEWFILLKEKTQWLRNEYFGSLLYVIQLIIVAIFSLCWLLILFHHVQNWFSNTSPHVFPVFAGFQLTLFRGVRQAGFSPPSVCRPVPGSSRSRQLPVSLPGTSITESPQYCQVKSRFHHLVRSVCHDFSHKKITKNDKKLCVTKSRPSCK